MCWYIEHTVADYRYKDGNGLDRICGDVDLKASQHYPQRFGLAVTECFLANYPSVVESVQKTKEELESHEPKKEAKDLEMAKIYSQCIMFIGVSVSVYLFMM